MKLITHKMDILPFAVLWQLLIKIINSILSSLITKEFHKNHKRTQQKVPNVFLLYIYYKYMVCVSNK